jgi:hypothetical protein
VQRSNAKNTIWGKVVASPEFAVVNRVSPRLPVICPNTTSAPEWELTHLLVGLMHV